MRAGTARLSYGHAGKVEAQLKAEVAALLKQVEAADQRDVPDGLSIPDELARREARLAKLAEARARTEARAREQHEREQAEYKAKLEAREAKAKASGKKPGGKPPKPPTAGTGPSDQINLTDADSRIMKVAGGGFEQCYNAQAVVAAGSMLVVATDVVDKQQVAPMVEKLQALPAALGKPEILLADSSYFSAANVDACQAAGIEPRIATGREPHHPALTERFAPAPKAPKAPKDPTPVEATAHRLKTPEGKTLYALRKQPFPEPVFDIIKSVLGFRQFCCASTTRSAANVSLVPMAWNVKRMFALDPA